MTKTILFVVSALLVFTTIMAATVAVADPVKPQSVAGQSLIGQRDNHLYMEYLIDNNGDGRPERLTITYIARPKGFIDDVVAQIDDLDGDGYADRVIMLDLRKNRPAQCFGEDSTVNPEYVTFDLVFNLEKEKLPIESFTTQAIFMLFVAKMKGTAV
jgi:hypothetical protein